MGPGKLYPVIKGAANGLNAGSIYFEWLLEFLIKMKGTAIHKCKILNSFLICLMNLQNKNQGVVRKLFLFCSALHPTTAVAWQHLDLHSDSKQLQSSAALPEEFLKTPEQSRQWSFCFWTSCLEEACHWELGFCLKAEVGAESKPACTCSTC